jgi:tetratricopeptide (TPR) repeat protein
MLAYARFGRWREVLTEPMPPAGEPYAIGIWHYTRALAFVARQDVTRATAELARLKEVMLHEAFRTTLKDLPLLGNLEIASRLARGEVLAHLRRFDDAVAVLQAAVTLEDAIPYNEPPVWHHPPRQVLGAVLLEAGRARDAERIYLQDLQRFRENGWSLFGLMRSLETQGRHAEAAAAKARFEKAWQRADVVLRSSRIIEDEPRSIALATGVTLEYVQRGNRPETSPRHADDGRSIPRSSCTASPIHGARSSGCCRTCRGM